MPFEDFVVPLCDFGVCEDGIVRAGDAGFESASDAVVGGVVAFCVAGRIVFVLPIAVLSCGTSDWKYGDGRGGR